MATSSPPRRRHDGESVPPPPPPRRRRRPMPPSTPAQTQTTSMLLPLPLLAALLLLLLLSAAGQAVPRPIAGGGTGSPPRRRAGSASSFAFAFAFPPRGGGGGGGSGASPPTTWGRCTAAPLAAEAAGGRGPDGGGGELGLRRRGVGGGRADGSSDAGAVGGGAGGGGSGSGRSRRDLLRAAAASAASAAAASAAATSASASASCPSGPSPYDPYRTYVQRFPAPIGPIVGRSSSLPTVKRRIAPDVWSIEQPLRLGPLETPLRCVVVRLRNGTGGLWVHNPLAPTEEFFDLVESCAHDGDGGSNDRRGPSSAVTHVVCSTYALEHKMYVRDALARWPSARLWTSPGQWSFPLASPPSSYVWGRDDVDGILLGSDREYGSNGEEEEDGGANGSAARRPPWVDEVQYETLTAGTYTLGLGQSVTLRETAFYHVPSRTLIVTDSVARIPPTPPLAAGGSGDEELLLNRPDNLLLISKRSTSDPMPDDTPQARRDGWEKTALLVSYFFPEHEELDPDRFGAVTWTEGWHDNFLQISGRILVPPVVRTLLYSSTGSNPDVSRRVREWVDEVVRRWDFVRVVPAHWDAPVDCTPEEFGRAFDFLEDGTRDAFPEEDLRRGLRPIAGLFR